MHFAPGQTYIHKLSAVRQTPDSLALEMNLARLLSSAELHPSGMSGSAIICILSLNDPLPRTVCWHQRTMRLSPTWEQAVRTTLEAIAQQAARPARQAVPANARAVLFADRAELLACLAKDWCEGRIAARWWWKSLFKGIDLNAVVLQSWREAPMDVPAALAILAEQQLAVSFIRVVPNSEVSTWLQMLTSTFALQELQTTLSPFTSHSPSQPIASEMVKPTATPLLCSPSSPVPSPTPPPWHRWVPETLAPGLSHEQQVVLGISLLLQRAPMVVRSHPFAVKVQHWMQTVYAPRPIPRDDPPAPILSLSASEYDAIPEQSTRKETQLLSTPSVSQEQILTNKPQLIRLNTLVATAMEQASPINEANATLETSAATEERATPATLSDHRTKTVNEQKGDIGGTLDDPGREINETLAEQELTMSVSTGAPILFAPQQEWHRQHQELREIETAFGGVFYLVNLGLYLELYSDFTNPLRPGIDLPLWDFVALLGRELVGSALESDPVWTLLTELAGRPAGEEPGTGVIPSEQMWKIIDAMAISIVLPHSLAPKGKGTLEKSVNSDTPLRHWLNQVIPLIRFRLQQALGLTTDTDLVAILCHHHARVRTTATHVDVQLSLAALPIAIRLAGLDRDPGWVPAAGRYVAFHFV